MGGVVCDTCQRQRKAQLAPRWRQLGLTCVCCLPPPASPAFSLKPTEQLVVALRHGWVDGTAELVMFKDVGTRMKRTREYLRHTPYCIRRQRSAAGCEA